MRTFDKEILQRIKERNQLIDIIQSYGISTKKRGNKYWACCPFHNEKTPSFSISPEEVFICSACE